MSGSDEPSDQPLFQRVLAQEWNALPTSLQAMHTFRGSRLATSTASIERGRNLASNLIAWVLGFPRAATSVPVTVKFECDGEAEIWTRRFGEAAFTTRLAPASAQSTIKPIVTESFGPLTFDLMLHIESHRLHLNPTAWRLFNITLPTTLLPQGNSYEFVDTGQFAFHIEIKVPLVGLIVRYRGTLEPADVDLSPESNRVTKSAKAIEH